MSTKHINAVLLCVGTTFLSCSSWNIHTVSIFSATYNFNESRSDYIKAHPNAVYDDSGYLDSMDVYDDITFKTPINQYVGETKNSRVYLTFWRDKLKVVSFCVYGNYGDLKHLLEFNEDVKRTLTKDFPGLDNSKRVTEIDAKGDYESMLIEQDDKEIEVSVRYPVHRNLTNFECFFVKVRYLK